VRRFLEMLNTPMAVLVVLVVAVAVNAFLFFGHYLPSLRTPTAPSSAPALTTERTRSAPMRTTVEKTDPEATEEQTQPATTPEVTTTATATATGSP
jgi:cytoskeletal protein RodZ